MPVAPVAPIVTIIVAPIGVPAHFTVATVVDPERRLRARTRNVADHRDSRVHDAGQRAIGLSQRLVALAAVLDHVLPLFDSLVAICIAIVEPLLARRIASGTIAVEIAGVGTDVLRTIRAVGTASAIGTDELRTIGAATATRTAGELRTIRAATATSRSADGLRTIGLGRRRTLGRFGAGLVVLVARV